MSSKEEELDLSVPSPNYSSEEELDLSAPIPIYSFEESQRRMSWLLNCLIGIVVGRISKLSPQHGHVIDLLRSLEYTSIFEYNDTVRNNFKTFVSLVQKLKVHFTVPNQQTMSHISLNLNPNQVVSVIINFHLLMIEVILYFEAGSIARVKGSIQSLQTELGFLINFLGDTAMHLQPTENIVTDIEAMVNEVGRFLYFFFITVILLVITMKKGIGFEAVVDEVGSLLRNKFFDFIEDLKLQTTKEEKGNKKKGKKLVVTKKEITGIKALVREVGSFLQPSIFMVSESGELDLALSNLLTKFDRLKTKIKEHCIAVSEMPSNMTPKTTVFSLFIVDSVLDDLMYTLNNNSDKIIGVEDQIVTLHKELMSLRCSVTDVAVQQGAEHEELMIRTGGIAYEVEYVINSFPHVWYLNLRLPQLIEKIQLIKMAIKEMKNNIDADGILDVAKYPAEQVSSQSTKYPVFGNITVGFEKLATEIVGQLVRGRDQLQIISIFGMPGIGKTTLANILYNDPSVVDRFDKRSWGVVSQTYNKKKLLIEILCSTSHSKREALKNMEEESLTLKLYQSLKGLRYLIVIDDIWDINVWNDLERYFPNDGVGSRILFTTRNKEVGSKASPRSIINALPLLSEAESWELLQGKVFKDENCPQELLDIGKQIAINCHGLPLAVVIIAAVLSNMEKKEHLWQKLERNLTSHISDNEHKFMQILELSYKHLPNHLKPCFLYFGTIAEDDYIGVQFLISHWVAEGFIEKVEQKCLEDVALKYLMELIDRSLIIVHERRSNGEVKRCKIHDLLREMCSRIGEKMNFLKLVNYNEDDPPMFFSQVLMHEKFHCMYSNYGESRFHSLPFGLHVRSLLFDCRNIEERSTIITSSFKVLRSFYLRGISYGHHLIGIEHLVHLRYLGISCKLPPMESFHKLEYLVVFTSSKIEIPKILLTMLSLRRMHFTGGAYFCASSRQQAIKDERFQLSNNLQSISVIRIFDEADEKILRCLHNLRRLKGAVGSSLNYSFDFLKQLESLRLQSEYGVLSSSLIILPLNLKQLTLVNVHVSPKQMETIGLLEYLEVLKLQHVAFEGEQWDTSEGEFPQLKFLKLYDVQLAEWNASGDNFPTLQRLVLQKCNNLKNGIPPNFGDILTLQMIEVDRCTKAVEVSAKKILEEQLDIGNEEFKVIISGPKSERKEQEERESEENEKSEEQEESENEEITDEFMEH
ncbi:putative late blight resistance protein homolog R1B-14 isoform X1 [Olea europaea var. sylvestris]|uniref:putative late blight resistance protein homolog R1B-14 isoform X1 n=2 Tax=Olea europaea var. sylvestris TaxID=158386 RepID=UPI000C1D2022|nr:putative late blight resistance protein homolog R1B-14 isoform X1 [Olea europaea var. sylvestris]XP_022886709.1 putative late blight resistance protein homolog R1B-14 isoform X1 [Olea europaea var. sylvestris]